MIKNELISQKIVIKNLKERKKEIHLFDQIHYNNINFKLKKGKFQQN